MNEIESSVPRRQLGRYLRQAREEAGISVDAAARELEWSRAKMYRIEGGQAHVRTHDVTTLCHYYEVSPEMTEALIGLAKEVKAKGWWHAYGEVIPDWFELYVGLEAAASHLRQYETALVPGLLQTPAYAEEVYRTRAGATEAEVRQAVALRLERQRLLTRKRPKPPELAVIMDESVLRGSITDRDGMIGQLRHLIEAAQQPGISFRVLPAVGPHAASAASPFVIMDFPRLGTRSPEPTTIYSENLTGALYLDRPSEISQYADAWQALSERALSEPETIDLVHTVLKESYDA